ncbi:2-hydroxyacid dehydrogenase [Lysobacter humi (ex Lee et al. 2017)]
MHLPDARVHAGLGAPPCDYAVLWKPPATVFAEQPCLKAVFSLGAGVDGLLAMPELPRGVPLVRMEDAGMAPQMFEIALYTALREFRGLRVYARDQAERRWSPRPARARVDFRIAVLGLGVLGGAVAKALAEFGFDVIGWSRGARDVPGVRCMHGPDALDGVLGASELVVLCLPSTASTVRLLDRDRLARMRPGAALLNIARGDLVDEAALVEALDAGRLGAAYLDVFQHEPLPVDHPFWSHPRVHVTPHVAALTDVELAAEQIAAKILRLQAGLDVTGIVDPARGY